jgi:hypothetical protein
VVIESASLLQTAERLTRIGRSLVRVERIDRMHNKLHRVARFSLIHPSKSGHSQLGKGLTWCYKAGPSSASAMAKVVLSDTVTANDV